MIIYKIENKINGKVYIGKTIDFKKRRQAHFNKNALASEPTKVLYLAMKKYGSENFEMSVLEEVNEENWEEKEIKWIEEYDSLKSGYNMIPGGTEPPRMIGEDHPLSKLDNQKSSEIIEFIKEGIFFKDIANMYSISTDQIYRINKGEAWKKENETYPIRKRFTVEEHLPFIISELKKNDLTQREIGEICGVSRTTITAINRGQNWKQEGQSYPIRSGRVQSKK